MPEAAGTVFPLAPPLTGVTGRTASRRGLLAALGSAAAASAVGRAAGCVRTGTAFEVRIYPGPTPGGIDTDEGWASAQIDASRAVRDAVARLALVSQARLGTEHVGWSVERASPIDLSVDGASQSATLDDFRERVRDRGAATGERSHLLLWWEPLNADLGYGGTRSETDHVAAVDGEGAYTVANVGATETWDSRAVTRNVSIHETLHTFLTGDIVESVIESRCEHDLGRAVRVEPDTLRISPMATAYAGPDSVGAGTTWHGTGCYDHDAFYRHDGLDGIDRFEYDTGLSGGVRDAVSRYADRYLTARER